MLVLFLRTQLARKEEEAKQADEGRSDEIPAHALKWPDPSRLAPAGHLNSKLPGAWARRGSARYSEAFDC